MITKSRWEVEQELVREHLPDFEPVVTPDDDRHGFQGTVVGPRTRTIYKIIIAESKAAAYPLEPPLIYVEPRLGPYCRESGGLSIGHPWRPLTDSFALYLGFACRYIQEYDDAVPCAKPGL